MLGLIYKDILILKKDILQILIIVALFGLVLLYPWADSGQFVNFQIASAVVTPKTMSYTIMPIFIYFIMFVIISVLQSDIFEHDEREEWINYVVASPLTIKGQVVSKYIISFGMSLVVVFYGVICDVLCMLVTGEKGSAWKIYVTYFLVQTILRAIELPFIIRFGHKHGKNYKILITVSIMYLGGVYALFGKLPSIGYSNILGEIINFLSDSKAMEEGFVKFFVGLIITAFFAYIISCKISQRVAKKQLP